MSMKKVSLQLYKDTQIAVSNINRYDSLERYALTQVLIAAKKNEQIDDLFIQCAQKALKHRSLNTSQVAV